MQNLGSRYSLAEIESRAQGSRSKTQKNPRPRTHLPRTDILEAKDRNSRDQRQRRNAEVILKKRSSLRNFVNFPENSSVLQEKIVFKCKLYALWRLQALCTLYTPLQALWRSSRRNKIGHDLGPFSTSQKNSAVLEPWTGHF